MKCPACGFEYNEMTKINDQLILCVTWAYQYTLGNTLPSKEQFKAMQKESFLPTHGERDGRKWELYYGHMGWAVDYDWPSIVAKITQKAITLSAT